MKQINWRKIDYWSEVGFAAFFAVDCVISAILKDWRVCMLTGFISLTCFQLARYKRKELNNTPDAPA